METLGGGPIADLAISGSEPTGGSGTDNVSLTAIDLTQSLVALTITGSVNLTAIDFTLSLESLTFVEYGQAKIFSFPIVNGYQTEPMVGPGWQLHFYDVGTTDAADVSSVSDFTELHAIPVKVDRFGNIPTIYVSSTGTYRFIIKNEYGVQKWEASSYVWPNTVEDHIDLDPLDFTLSLETLTTSEP